MNPPFPNWNFRPIIALPRSQLWSHAIHILLTLAGAFLLIPIAFVLVCFLAAAADFLCAGGSAATTLSSNEHVSQRLTPVAGWPALAPKVDFSQPGS
jgi:hypothetical protein